MTIAAKTVAFSVCLCVARGSQTLLQDDLACDRDGSLTMLQSKAAAKNAKRKSLWFTDLHADPYYLTDARECIKKNVSALRNFPLGVLGCDPPGTLLSDVLTAMTDQKLEVGADFAVFTGDFSRHRMELMENPYVNVSTIIGQVSSLFAKHLPNTSKVFGTLGNDDTPLNYFQNITTDKPENRWFETCGAELEKAHCLPSELRKEFDYGNYFEVRREKFSILNIATLMYSVAHKPVHTSGTDPFHQFAWLRARLMEAAREKRKVWIIGHIPPGMETFGYTELWEPRFVQEYLSIVQDQVMGSVIAAQLFGHVHKDEIRILPNPPPDAGPILLSTSLSPIFYNQPAFKTVTLRDDGELLDFETFFGEISNSSSLDYRYGYSFRTLYGLTQLSMASLTHLARELMQGTEQWRSYAKWYTSTYPNDLNHFAWNASDPPAVAKGKTLRRQQYVCGITIQTMESYEDCVQSAKLSIYKSSDTVLGRSPERLVAALPKSLPPEDSLLLARLVRWAENSDGPQADHILHLAQQQKWLELWELYSPAVEQSVELGVPLDDVLGHR